MKSFSQEGKKEKEKLKSLENVHFQNHFSKQTFQVFLSKLRFLLTFACLIIYVFKWFGEDDLKYSRLFDLVLLWRKYFCSPDAKLREKQIQSAQGPVWCLYSDYCDLGPSIAGSTSPYRWEGLRTDFSGEGTQSRGASGPKSAPAFKPKIEFGSHGLQK